MNIDKNFTSSYAYAFRYLKPYQRLEYATLNAIQGLALLEDEINMQNSYRAMDMGSMNTTHHKKAVEYLHKAIDEMKKASAL